MADQWYYARDDQKVGPVTSDTLRSLASSGQVVPSDMVWCEGMAQWAPAGQVPGLFPGAAAPVITPSESQAGDATTLNYRTRRSLRSADYAGFWRRFSAFFVDGLVLFVPNCFILGFISACVGWGVAEGAPISWLVATTLVVDWPYFALMESSRWQGTLGKRMCGIQVTDLAGDRLRFGHAAGRSLAKAISLMTLYFGFTMAGFTEKKQGLHDMIAGTLVVVRR